MRNVLKWIGIVIGSLVSLIALTALILFLVSGARWNQDYENFEVPVQSVPIPVDAASIARGEHLATTHYCGFCHNPDLSGEVLINEPVLAVIYAPNLTPGKGGIGEGFTDNDWVQALRHGVGGDGRGLVGMPSRVWFNLSDADLGALIAYLKSLPPVEKEIPKRVIGPMGRVLVALGQFPPSEASMIDHQTTRPNTPESGVSAGYGSYLAQTTCSACHGVDMNGGLVRGLDGELEITLNLTPGGALGGWSEADFITTLRSGVTPNGRQLSDTMPWQFVGQMTDEELRAVWLYLSSLPAMEQGGERIDL